MSTLPELFVERLRNIIPAQALNPTLNSFGVEKSISFRINRCHPDMNFKNTSDHIWPIPVTQVPWYEDAFILTTNEDITVLDDDCQQGRIYRQGLSSMLVPIILDIRGNNMILDVCAAPGSKTTQMASMLHNQGKIIALESVKNRFYKLRANVSLQQAAMVDLVRIDARRYRPEETYFDRILVDAPCSSEGRFQISEKKTYAYWSLRKVREMRKKQKGLLLQASRLLKPGGVLVYSTCTFAPEENEQVVDWFLRKTAGTMILEDVDKDKLHGVTFYPPILKWNKKEYNKDVQKCLRILPSQTMDGFFITKFKRKR